MTTLQVDRSLANAVADIARSAGQKIMAIYEQDFAIYDKSDSSPLTEADLAAHEYIVSALAQISDLPVLSEESADISWQERKKWTRYWLVDPLDGTKEFIKKNGEFTVNIALIEFGEPSLGVVYAPAINACYVGVVGDFAELSDSQGTRSIKARTWREQDVCKVVGSRSHQSPEITKILDALNSKHELVAMGSSLKICLVAAGEAHLYPRVGPTSEWDTGAAHAVALAAGAKVTVLDPDSPFDPDASPLKYNQKDSLLNPFFLVAC